MPVGKKAKPAEVGQTSRRVTRRSSVDRSPSPGRKEATSNLVRIPEGDLDEKSVSTPSRKNPRGGRSSIAVVTPRTPTRVTRRSTAVLTAEEESVTASPSRVTKNKSKDKTATIDNNEPGARVEKDCENNEDAAPPTAEETSVPEAPSNPHGGRSSIAIVAPRTPTRVTRRSMAVLSADEESVSASPSRLTRTRSTDRAETKDNKEPDTPARLEKVSEDNEDAAPAAEKTSVPEAPSNPRVGRPSIAIVAPSTSTRVTRRSIAVLTAEEESAPASPGRVTRKRSADRVETKYSKEADAPSRLEKVCEDNEDVAPPTVEKTSVPEIRSVSRPQSPHLSGRSTPTASPDRHANCILPYSTPSPSAGGKGAIWRTSSGSPSRSSPQTTPRKTPKNMENGGTPKRASLGRSSPLVRERVRECHSPLTIDSTQAEDEGSTARIEKPAILSENAATAKALDVTRVETPVKVDDERNVREASVPQKSPDLNSSSACSADLSNQVSDRVTSSRPVKFLESGSDNSVGQIEGSVAPESQDPSTEQPPALVENLDTSVFGKKTSLRRQSSNIPDDSFPSLNASSIADDSFEEEDKSLKIADETVLACGGGVLSSPLIGLSESLKRTEDLNASKKSFCDESSDCLDDSPKPNEVTATGRLLTRRLSSEKELQNNDKTFEIEHEVITAQVTVVNSSPKIGTPQSNLASTLSGGTSMKTPIQTVVSGASVDVGKTSLQQMLKVPSEPHAKLFNSTQGSSSEDEFQNNGKTLKIEQEVIVPQITISHTSPKIRTPQSKIPVASTLSGGSSKKTPIQTVVNGASVDFGKNLLQQTLKVQPESHAKLFNSTPIRNGSQHQGSSSEEEFQNNDKTLEFEQEVTAVQVTVADSSPKIGTPRSKIFIGSKLSGGSSKTPIRMGSRIPKLSFRETGSTPSAEKTWSPIADVGGSPKLSDANGHDLVKTGKRKSSENGVGPECQESSPPKKSQVENVDLAENSADALVNLNADSVNYVATTGAELTQSEPLATNASSIVDQSESDNTMLKNLDSVQNENLELRLGEDDVVEEEIRLLEDGGVVENCEQGANKEVDQLKPSEGDTGAEVEGGNAETEVEGGNAEAEVGGGDAEAEVEGGGAEADNEGGDAEAEVEGSDIEAEIKGGNAVAEVEGGDAEVEVEECDPEVEDEGSDAEAEIKGGDAVAEVEGGDPEVEDEGVVSAEEANLGSEDQVEEDSSEQQVALADLLNSFVDDEEDDEWKMDEPGTDESIIDGTESSNSEEEAIVARSDIDGVKEDNSSSSESVNVADFFDLEAEEGEEEGEWRPEQEDASSSSETESTDDDSSTDESEHDDLGTLVETEAPVVESIKNRPSTSRTHGGPSLKNSSGSSNDSPTKKANSSGNRPLFKVEPLRLDKKVSKKESPVVYTSSSAKGFVVKEIISQPKPGPSKLPSKKTVPKQKEKEMSSVNTSAVEAPKKRPLSETEPASPSKKMKDDNEAASLSKKEKNEPEALPKGHNLLLCNIPSAATDAELRVAMRNAGAANGLLKIRRWASKGKFVNAWVSYNSSSSLQRAEQCTFTVRNHPLYFVPCEHQGTPSPENQERSTMESKKSPKKWIFAFIKNLPEGTTVEDIVSGFKTQHVDLGKFECFKLKTKSNRKVFAKVGFSNMDDLQRAMTASSNVRILGKKITLKPVDKQ